MIEIQFHTMPFLTLNSGLFAYADLDNHVIRMQKHITFTLNNTFEYVGSTIQ